MTESASFPSNQALQVKMTIQGVISIKKLTLKKTRPTVDGVINDSIDKLVNTQGILQNDTRVLKIGLTEAIRGRQH